MISEKNAFILKNAVERNADIVGPHPRPFSRRAKGENPLSLRERVGVRAKPLPNMVLQPISPAQLRFLGSSSNRVGRVRPQAVTRLLPMCRLSIFLAQPLYVSYIFTLQLILFFFTFNCP